MADQPIRCDLHDYVEISCLFQYEVRIDNADGSSVSGIALTTVTTDGEEFLQLRSPAGVIDVPLATALRLVVLTNGARFECVEFADPTAVD